MNGPLDGSVNDPSATDLIVAAVDQLLRNIVMSLLMDKSSYKLGHDANKTPHSVGSAAPNPYLVTKQRSDDFNGEQSKPSAQGNLLKGIVIWVVAARSVVQSTKQSFCTSHSAYVATSTESNGVKIDGLLPPNFL